MLLLESFWVPLLEFLVSIGIPFVLTLKSLQLTQNPQINKGRLQELLIFWVNYWLILFVLQYVGIKSHFRLCLSMVYLVQKKLAAKYLIKLYEESLLSSLSTIFHKVLNLKITKDAVDELLYRLIENLCFNDLNLEWLLIVLKGEFFTRVERQTQAQVPRVSSDSVLNIQKTRRKTSVDQVSDAGRRLFRKSSGNLRSRAHTPIETMDIYSDHDNSNVSSRKSSHNLANSRNISMDGKNTIVVSDHRDGLIF